MVAGCGRAGRCSRAPLLPCLLRWQEGSRPRLRCSGASGGQAAKAPRRLLWVRLLLGMCMSPRLPDCLCRCERRSKGFTPRVIPGEHAFAWGGDPLLLPLPPLLPAVWIRQNCRLQRVCTLLICC